MSAFHGLQRQASFEMLSFLRVPLSLRLSDGFCCKLPNVAAGVSTQTAKTGSHPESYSGTYEPDPKGKTHVQCVNE